jgi:SlyX protein
MDQPIDTDKRLTELEIKASFTEDLVDELNRIVTRQQLQIDSLLRQLADLRQQGAAADPGITRSLRDELPPHY